MVSSKDTWWNLETVTIEQIMDNGKRVYFMSADYLTHMKDSEHLGIYD